MRKLMTAMAATLGMLLTIIQPAGTIVGGEPAADRAPSRSEGIGLVRIRGAVCTGSLISPTVVLTATHCVFDPSPRDVMTVTFNGGTDDEETIAVIGSGVNIRDGVRVAPDFDFFFNNDLALLFLEAEPDVKPMKWTSDNVDYPNPKKVTAYGHGCVDISCSTIPDPNVLKEIGLWAQPDQEFVDFSEVPPFVFTPDARVGATLNKEMSYELDGPCIGDSGGPVIRGDRIIGVLSLQGTENRPVNPCDPRVYIYEQTSFHADFIKAGIAEAASLQ